MDIHSFLASKPLFYEKIDYERFPKIYNKIKHIFQLPKIIHIVGTNAKGSTGRALAYLLYKEGKSVGHYTSPHILHFNERIWINGKDIEETLLQEAHEFLQNNIDLDDIENLSYFEYTTLLAMHLFCIHCEYAIVEAGLGGEFDATNVFTKQLSILTVVGKDHQSFLGESIEEIANTKLRSIQNDAIIAKQEDSCVYDLAKKHLSKLKYNLIYSEQCFSVSWRKKMDQLIVENDFPGFFADNFTTAFCAFKYLGFEVKIESLLGLKIFGRCQKISHNITLDVGHNPLGARALLKHFRDKKVNLVYNSYNDKEYEKILKILRPVIQSVHILKIDNERSVNSDELMTVLKDLEIPYEDFHGINQDEQYLVFGSFSVVEAFLKGYFEK